MIPLIGLDCLDSYKGEEYGIYAHQVTIIFSKETHQIPNKIIYILYIGNVKTR